MNSRDRAIDGETIDASVMGFVATYPATGAWAPSEADKPVWDFIHRRVGGTAVEAQGIDFASLPHRVERAHAGAHRQPPRRDADGDDRREARDDDRLAVWG